MECARRQNFASPSMKMDNDFDADTEKECIICHYDLHLSAVGCQCSPGQYACLMHAKQLCSCAPSTRSLLFRYELHELNLLVEALEGKLSAIHRWANKDLGLALSSYVRGSKARESNRIGGGLQTEGAKQKEEGPSTATTSTVIAESTGLCKEIHTTMSRISSPDVGKERERRRLNSTGTVIGPSLQEQERNQSPSVNPRTKNMEELGDKNMHYVQGCSLSESKMNDHNGQFRELALSSELSISDLKDKCLSDSNNALKSKRNGFPLPGNGNVINDNEGEDAHESIFNVKYSDIPVRLTECDGKVTPCNYEDQTLNMHRTDASMMNERDTNVLIMVRMEHLLRSMHKKVGDHRTSETGKNTDNVSRGPFFQSPADNMKYVSEALGKQIEDYAPCELTDSGDVHQHHHPNGSLRSINSFENGKSALDFYLKVGDTASHVSQSPTCKPKSPDDACSQESPCIANVEGIKYIVEPLEYGMVLPGKLWSNNKVIFPKGMFHTVHMFHNNILSRMMFLLKKSSVPLVHFSS